MKGIISQMQETVDKFKRGYYTIGECEFILNQYISLAIMDIADLDERLELLRLLKRKEWRMMLDATRKKVRA